MARTRLPQSETDAIQRRVSYLWMAATAAAERGACRAVLAVLDDATDRLQRLPASESPGQRPMVLRGDGEEATYRPEKQPWHRAGSRRQPVDDEAADDDPYSL